MGQLDDIADRRIVAGLLLTVVMGVRELLTETLSAATPEDWQAISDQLIANARDVLEAHRPAADREQELADSRRAKLEEALGVHVTETFVLTDEAWQAFCDALGRPPRVNPALVSLFRRELPRQDAPAAGARMIALSNCTGEQLERGEHCDSPDCPNRTEPTSMTPRGGTPDWINPATRRVSCPRVPRLRLPRGRHRGGARVRDVQRERCREQGAR